MSQTYFFETPGAEVFTCSDCASKLARQEFVGLVNVASLPLRLMCEHAYESEVATAQYGSEQAQPCDLMTHVCHCGHVRAAHRHGQTGADAPVTVGRCCLCDCAGFATVSANNPVSSANGADETQHFVESCPVDGTQYAAAERAVVAEVARRQLAGQAFSAGDLARVAVDAGGRACGSAQAASRVSRQTSSRLSRQVSEGLREVAAILREHGWMPAVAVPTRHLRALLAEAQEGGAA